MWDPDGDPIGMPRKKRPSRSGTKSSKAGAEIDEPFEETLRRWGIEPLREPDEPRNEPHPLTPAGPKLKVLREKSGWTDDEIADRTGVPLKVLKAFEKGDSKAAEKLDLSDLERLASACCGSLTDLLGSDVESVRRALRRRQSSFFDSLF
jgi:hypothetical protein